MEEERWDFSDLDLETRVWEEKVGVRRDFIEQGDKMGGIFGTKVLSGSWTTFLLANKSRNILLFQSRSPNNIRD